MAEGLKKISDLPALTGTVENSYNLAIDDGSVTYKVSVEHFEEAAAHTASEYAAAAAASAEAAAAAAGEAATTATTIETDISTATRLVNDARGYASSAADSVTAAQAASGAATTKANEASNSANAAAGSAGEAAASSTSASNYANNAQAEANRARSWADYPNEATHGSATNNAHYWADVARAIAGGGVVSFNGRGGIVVPEEGDYSAGMISYDNTSSGLTATDAQGAIDEVNTNLGSLDTEVGQIETDLSDYHVTPSKNRAIPNGTRRTLASVTYTEEANGVIDVDGTATGSNSFYYISEHLEWENEEMVISGCPSGGDASTYRLIVSSSEDSGASVYVSDTGSGAIVPANTGGSTLTLDIYIRVAQNASVSHKKFSPMFCSKAAYDADPTYVPYYPAMRDGMLPRSENRILGAKNLAGVNDIKWLNLSSATHTKTETGLDIQTAAANTSGVYSDNPSAVQSLIDKYGSLTVSFIYKSDIACAGSIGANADSGRYTTLQTNWTKYEFTFTPSMSSPHLQFYNRDNTKTPKISVRDIMFRLPSDPDDTFAPRVFTNAELTDAKNGTISYENGISQQTVADKPLYKQGNICCLAITLTGITSNQGAWVSIGTLPTGFIPQKSLFVNATKNGSSDVLECQLQTNGNIRLRDNSAAIASTDYIHFNGTFIA